MDPSDIPKAKFLQLSAKQKHHRTKLGSSTQWQIPGGNGKHSNIPEISQIIVSPEQIL